MLKRTILFSVLAGLHAAGLYALDLGNTRTDSPPQPAPIVAILVPPQPEPVVAAPQPQQRPVKPVSSSAGHPAPLPPLRQAAPSSHTPTASAVEPTQTAPAATSEAAKEVAAAPAAQPLPPGPVVPPRSDASHLQNTLSYPPVSRRLGEEGKVVLSVYILPNGTVGELKLKMTSGFPRLDEAALEQVRRWRYVPARRGDEAIPFWYTQPIVFSLEG